MSDALSYLMKIRPQVMDDYFSFIKRSGEHLDERTRAIISVITKVDKQTEKGFRQYVKRALACGVTANEIIDALFVAFPTLGLSKIVWAADILLEMELPEFSVDQLSSPPTWHKVIAADKIGTGVTSVENCDGRDLLVLEEGGNFRVADARCPHQSTRLVTANVQENRIICPAHGWKFDAGNGRCIEKGSKDLTVYESKIEEACLLALW